MQCTNTLRVTVLYVIARTSHTHGGVANPTADIFGVIPRKIEDKRGIQGEWEVEGIVLMSLLSNTSPHPM